MPNSVDVNKYARHESKRLLVVIHNELDALEPLDALRTVRDWLPDLDLDYRGRPLDDAEKIQRGLDTYHSVPYSPAVGVGVAFYQSKLEDHNDDQR